LFSSHRSYLQECGFVHSAFSFVHESMLGRTGLRSADKTVPPGALVTFLQKGLQYVEIEERLSQENNKDGRKSEIDYEFSILSPAAVSSITRANPPILLNVPPAAAAAALKARLEAQAKIDEDRRSTQLPTADSPPPLPMNGSLETPVVTHSPELEDPNVALARRALATQAAAAHAMSQLQQIGQPPMTDVLALVQPPHQQQPRVVMAADIMALQQQSAVIAGHMDGVELADGVEQAAAALPALTDIVGAQGGKRSVLGSKRNAKKQKTSKSSEIPATKQHATGFASLEEAVAQLEAKNKDRFTQPAIPSAEAMDVEATDEQAHPVEMISQEPAHKGQEPEPLPSQAFVNGENDTNGRLVEYHNETGNGTNDVPQEKARPNPGTSKPEVDDSSTMAKSDEILELEMHQSEVFMCAWNPIFTNLIATGSGDASARIWEMGGKYACNGLKAVKLLPHGSDTRDLKNKDVTTLEWSSNGELLATGSYDGVARIWSRSGALLHTLRGHHGPIFSLKWNKRGNYLLSGSYDKTTIVWDVSESTGYVVQQFTDHRAPALDVDWKDNETFASCSTDKTVQVCRVGTPRPIKVYTGHTDEVNGVKWDPSGRFLASCSDDCTAKVWEVDSDRTGPLYDFNRHTEEIYTLKWSPNTSNTTLLATASFDGTVMLWNIDDGSRYRVFDRHSDSVYSVAFSPSGDYLASGSLAGQMYIWDIEENRHIKSYKGTGDIFEVAWNKEETRVAGCFSSNVVAVVDFKKSTL
jgi:WD40 repeat protein